MWFQQQIQLPAKARGFHLITREIVGQLPQLRQINIGLAHFFLQHTSAALAINENADADVRRDLENYFSRLVPENAPYFQHTLEGPDDMPAHIKSVMLGVSLTVPVSAGQLALGVWQGIYLCEHRNQGGRRSILVTLNGE
jgi:secondary thiamine-phosphate synthase enzyme